VCVRVYVSWTVGCHIMCIGVIHNSVFYRIHLGQYVLDAVHSPNAAHCLSRIGTVFGYTKIYLYEGTLSAGRRRVSDRVAKGVFCIRSGATNIAKSKINLQIPRIQGK